MNSKQNRRWSSVGSVLLGLVISVTGMTVAQAQDRGAIRSVPTNIEALRLDSPLQLEQAGSLDSLYKIAPDLVGASGKAQVIVRLQSPAAAELDDGAARMSRKVNIESEQAALIQRFGALASDMKVIARTQLVLNAVFIEVDAKALPQLANDPAVARIAPVGNYELDLSDTVPYIGAAAVQAAGIDGDGISIAILDSGIDYTHANMGGPGTLEAYEAAWGTGIGDPTQTTRDGLFPTAKVVDGYDFVGELWPTFGPLLPDEDPIDFEGHGSHVADIAAGLNGVAPGADLYAVKVCSAVSSSCSGVALIQGMEFSVDPNGDGDPEDAVDIINMSLGANYGQAFDDDLSAAVDNATALGVLTVSSAGNCGDNPYCTGTPSSAPTALSVAQTQVPSAKLFFMNVIEPEESAGLKNAVKYPWTPDPAGLIQGPVQYADGAGGNLDGCAPFAAGSLAGQIVAVDRGGCFFSDKIRNIENAGGVLGIVMLIDDSVPFPGGFGGGPPINIPGFNISNADGDILRPGNAVVAFGPDFTEPLVGYTVSSTARGPDMSGNSIKPEIGAPGASVSLEVGTGTGETPFGGTSGASPMVAGSAALVLESCLEDNGDSDSDSDSDSDGNCSPEAVKARLVNTGYRDIISDTTGDLAEVTRIGGGEVRVDAAVNAPFYAYVVDDDQPTLSLGQIDGVSALRMTRKVRIVNLSDDDQRINVTPTFRSAAGSADGAVRVSAPRSVTVEEGDDETFNISFRFYGTRMNPNAMNSGSSGNSEANLGINEIAGYLLLSSSDGEIALPWHALARQAAYVQADSDTIVPGGFPSSIGLMNYGAGVAQNDAYTIVGLSDEKPRGPKGGQAPMPDLRAFGVNTIPVPAGFCSADPSFLWIFAFNTWDRQTHLVPVSHQVALDVDLDGIDDYVVLNRDLTFNNVTDGRQVSWVLDTRTGDAGAFFFAEHATNTGNTALIFCAEQIGFSQADFFRNVNATVTTQDFYYGGGNDVVGGITIAPLGEGFLGLPSGDLARGQAGTLDVFDFGPLPGNSPEYGVMLFTNGDRGAGARGGASEDTEALLFLAPGVDAPAPLPEENDADSDSD